MHVKSSYNGLVVPSLIWMAALGAAALGAHLRGVDLMAIWPLALVGAAPAIISLLMTPALRKEWAQLLVMFAWLTLAIIACLTIGFVPMALMFLCAPVAAALFAKEKVVEALVMATLIAGVIFYADHLNRLPQTTLNEAQILWGQQAGLMATLGLIISCLLGAARMPQSAKSQHEQLSPKETQKILNAVNGGVFTFNSEDYMVDANEQGRTLFSLPADLKQQTLSNLSPHDDAAQADITALIKEARKSKKAKQKSVILNEKEHLTYLDLQATPLGKNIVLHAKDVTQQEQNLINMQSAQTAASQENQGKSLFFAGVSHELRTPLNAIIGFSDMMRSRLFGPLPSKYAEYADLIHESGQHMLDLIGDVLDMSKVEAGKYELNYNMFDAADVVRSTVKMIRPAADESHVRLDINIEDDEALLIDADRKAVRQILLNLISNAIKFSPKGAAIHIGAKAVDQHLQLTVQDQGSGMSEDELAQLGTPYKQMSSAQQVETRGTGLGISLVKSLTQLHKGRFAVASQKDVGTTVDVFLPLTKA